MNRKKHRTRKAFPALFALLLTAFTAFALLDTFVIPHSYSAVSTEAADEDPAASELGDAENGTSTADDGSETTETEGGKHRRQPGTETAAADSQADEAASSSSSDAESTYTAEGLTITLSQHRVADTTVYVADVVTDDPAALKTALAEDTYGRNITESTSAIAADSGAVLAINGDFYGARTSGYVIRNGILYRETSSGGEDLVIWADGSFSIIDEDEITAQELLDRGAVQVLAFGPALIENGQVAVTESDEVGKAMASNPRTAIGIIEEGHYVLVVSDGRTDESEGLTLRELADFMAGLGVSTAYNLDGGGSSTMVFQGQVVNQPTTGGNTIKEREVSDIVYIPE